MDSFDDEFLAVVRDLAATVGVPEHLRPAAAGRARRADIPAGPARDRQDGAARDGARRDRGSV
jgi:hypothetical protein